MEGTDQSEVLLLKETYRVIWEIAQFFVGDDKKAQRARKRLKKKDPDSGAFYVNLSQDLEKLGDVLQGIPDTWSDGQQGSGTRAVRKLLNVVQTRFLIDFGDRSGDEAEDFKLEVLHNSQPVGCEVPLTESRTGQRTLHAAEVLLPRAPKS